MTQRFGPEQLLACYRRGVFPMADSRDDLHVFLMEPEQRGVIPLDGLKVTRSMRRWMKKTPFTTSINQAFESVIKACAEIRDETWISHGIEHLYGLLHKQGDAHSIEVWDGGELIGGLYGVSQGGAFFGESMFSLRPNASKLALVTLVQRLNDRGFTLLDTQFLTDHLASLGGIEISRDDYQKDLKAALEVNARFFP